MTSYIISIISCPSYPVSLQPFAPHHISSSLSMWFSKSLTDLHYPLVCLSSTVYLTVCVSTLIASFFHSVVSLTSRSLSFFMSICVSEYLIPHLSYTISVFLHVCLSFWVSYSISVLFHIFHSVSVSICLSSRHSFCVDI